MNTFKEFSIYGDLINRQSEIIKLMENLIIPISPERINEMSQFEINEFIRKYDELVEKHRQYLIIFHNQSKNKFVKYLFNKQLQIKLDKLHMVRIKFE